MNFPRRLPPQNQAVIKVNYADQVRSIRKRFPIDHQQRKLNVLLNEATRSLSLLPSTAIIERQKLAIDLNAIRTAISHVSSQINNLQR